jgi:hypothetical protein
MDTEAIINWADESINAVNLLSGGMALFQIEENVLLGVSNWRQSANDLPSGGLGGYRLSASAIRSGWLRRGARAWACDSVVGSRAGSPWATILASEPAMSAAWTS